MAWIHDRPEWPRFTWDDAALTSALAGVRHRQGRHVGRVEALGFDVRAETNIAALTDEVVRSSAIEGEHLDPGAVRSSIARRLGLDTAGLPFPGGGVEGAVAMTLDAARNFESPLTAERLHGWHAALFPTGRSGMIRCEIQRFLEWFAATAIDPVLKASVAHFWFVTIHPFDDGNGRIGRAIADLALAQADDTKERFYSMSKGIAARRTEYYRQLEAAQRGGPDITAWLLWFLSCLDQTIRDAGTQLGAALEKAQLRQRIDRHPLNERQRKIIDRLLDNFPGHLTTSKYAKLAKCSNDTALRDIRDLLARAIIVRNAGGGRSTSYRVIG